MEVIPMAALAFTVMTVVNLLKYVRAADWNGVGTILTVWIAGVAGLLLFAQSAWAETITFGPLSGGVTLADLNFASIVIIGLQIGSAGVITNEFKKAFDNNDSAAKPDLLPSSTPEA